MIDHLCVELPIQKPVSPPWMQVRNHLQSFLAGAVAALSFGYYRVHQDVWRAAEAVDGRLGALATEVSSSHAVLQTRIDELEVELHRQKAVVVTGEHA